MALAQKYLQVEKEHYTEDEYFEFEQTAFGRWEFVAGKIHPVAEGEIRAMAGGSDDHGAIASNIVRILGNILIPKGCRVYGSDVKVHTGDGTNTFPDAMVICGERQYHRGRTDIVTNPLLIVEVLSPSTEGYDRSEKFDHYQTIPTLTDYLLVAQDAARTMLYTRDGDHWDFRLIEGIDSSVFLPSVDITLMLADIYTLIEFPARETP